MNKLRNQKQILWLCGALVIASLAILVIYELQNRSAGKNKYSSGGSYNTTAWKFANLVQADVLYPVVRDIDGDTVVVNVAGHGITVRLIGADTPETVDPRKPVQCYGSEASAEAKRIFGVRVATSAGISVYLDKDPAKGDYDKYGRLLAYIRMPDDIIPGVDVYNEYMIIKGFAHEYTYFKEPYKYQAQFKADELAAKKARVGLWGACPASG